MYRAERLDGKGIVEGYYVHYKPNKGEPEYDVHYIMTGNSELFYGAGTCEEIFHKYSIKPETLEIYLFGEWRKVSELEAKYKLVKIVEYKPHIDCQKRETCEDYRKTPWFGECIHEKQDGSCGK